MNIPVHALYGRPVDSYRLSHVADAPIAAASREYVGRGDLCEGNDNTCKAHKQRGQHLCYGHMRSYVPVIDSELED
jgi:hypothetical protein